MAGKEEGVKETLGGVENKISQILGTIAMDISGFVNDQNAFNEKITNDTLELTLSICRKLFPVLSEEGKLTEVSSMTVSMISQILAQPKITIFVNSDIIVSLKDKIDHFLVERGYEGIASILEDPSLPVSGCRIQWQGGEALRNPEAGLQDIEQIISASLTDQVAAPHSSQGPSHVTGLGVGSETKAVNEFNNEGPSDTSPVGTTHDDEPKNQKLHQTATTENLAQERSSQGYISRDELTESASDADLGLSETHDKGNPDANG